MTKKSRLSKDAFDWVKDTNHPKAAASTEKTSADAAERHPGVSPLPNSDVLLRDTSAAPDAGRKRRSPGRRVYVKYLLENGSIISIAEAPSDRSTTDRHPFVRVGSGEAVYLFRLQGDIETESLAAIHEGHRVKLTGQTPSLVRAR